MSTAAFDFDAHRSMAIRAYTEVRPIYERLCAAVEPILRMAIRPTVVHQISTRAKSITSFADKAAKPSSEDPTRPKYDDPLRQITDLAGARIIAFVLRDVPRIEEAVQQEFNIVDRVDKGEELITKTSVGYRSIHYIVELPDRRTNLLEYGEFNGFQAEIQIRTILQHAWAEMEHDIRFKPGSGIDLPLFQRFTALAGLIEVGDREFDQVFEMDARRKNQVRELAQITEAIPPDIASDATTQTDGTDNGTWTAPRELIGDGRYSDAIVAYNRLIEVEPRQFAHVLGRAKARFLNGDVEGAMTDISRAESLSPGHRFIDNLRQAITGRTLDSDTATSEAVQRRTVAQGFDALTAGDGAGAYELYEEAEKHGYSPVMSTLNRAMSRLVEGRPQDALTTLSRLNPFPESIADIVSLILREICYALLQKHSVAEANGRIDEVRRRAFFRNGIPFSFNKSRLSALERGVRQSTGLSDDQKEIVYAILQPLHEGQ
ncbi:MAG TPA: tetratricopeptide repeat protein [Candidatus Elarobacter sp.]|jgi:ppGpp synthetase/RelA/SpoT-type nucleotidyltranferase|nr:tetratricopeptide repeat protein [Candidatus Elarobacter sp.]